MIETAQSFGRGKGDLSMALLKEPITTDKPSRPAQRRIIISHKFKSSNQISALTTIIRVEAQRENFIMTIAI